MKLIPLTRGLFAKVDDDDFDRINKFKWHAHFSSKDFCYAARAVGNQMVYMHTFILGEVDGKHIDHINNDSLDNQKDNLRFCTQQQNCWNTKKRKKIYSSVYKGVRKHKNRFVAQYTKDYKNTYIGIYDTEREAALAYDKKAKELFGEYACLNFPGE